MGYLNFFPEKINYAKEIKRCKKILEKSPYNSNEQLLKPMQQSQIHNYHSLRKTYIKQLMQNEFRLQLKDTLIQEKQKDLILE